MKSYVQAHQDCRTLGRRHNADGCPAAAVPDRCVDVAPLATPGFGYRVHQGDRVLIATMFHNETETSYPDTHLEVQIQYQPLVAGDAGLKNVYPTWFDVKNCGRSGYDLTPGENVTTGRFSLGYSGALIGVGGHLHDYGRQLRLVDTARKQDIAKLDAKLDPRGSHRLRAGRPFYRSRRVPPKQR